MLLEESVLSCLLLVFNLEVDEKDLILLGQQPTVSVHPSRKETGSQPLSGSGYEGRTASAGCHGRS